MKLTAVWGLAGLIVLPSLLRQHAGLSARNALPASVVPPVRGNLVRFLLTLRRPPVSPAAAANIVGGVANDVHARPLDRRRLSAFSLGATVAPARARAPISRSPSRFPRRLLMLGHAGIASKSWRVARWAALAAAAPALWACTSRTLETPNMVPTATIQTNFTQKVANELDLLFMVDNSLSMKEMQQKLYDQLPLFIQVLQQLKNPPSLHLAVVSSDMGAPGDSTVALSCNHGQSGDFQSMAQGTCLGTTLTPGATFITNADGMPNFTDGNIADVFQCIALLGDGGCGFENQLASIDAALGAQGLQPGQTPNPPSTNVGFLRPEAYLGIVILTNEDDCSAPSNTTIYSQNGYQQNIADPDGPLTNYRCNGGPRGAHYCQDPANGNAWTIPPLFPPPDAQGTAAAPTLDLAGCIDNEQSPMGTGTSALTPVSQFISDIKSLKPDPDNQILVAAIAAPAAPYTVEWLPESQGTGTKPGELWPSVMHSCGTKGGPDVSPTAQSATDSSFGDPGVRISRFVSAFPNYVLASICDASYASSMAEIAKRLGQLITPPCITGTIENDGNGQPECSVVEHLTDMQQNKKDRVVQSCAETNNAAPCWTLAPPPVDPTNPTTCAGQQLTITDEAGIATNLESSTINCALCLPGSTEPGCP
jgi:hypothetical protein